MKLLEQWNTKLRLWLLPQLLGRTFGLIVLAPHNEEPPVLPSGTTLNIKVYCEPEPVLLPVMILNQAPWLPKDCGDEYLLTFMSD